MCLLINSQEASARHQMGRLVEELPKPLADPLENAKSGPGTAFEVLWGAWAHEVSCTKATREDCEGLQGLWKT